MIGIQNLLHKIKIDIHIPKPRGLYNKLGFGKKKGNAFDVGMFALEDWLLLELWASCGFDDFVDAELVLVCALLLSPLDALTRAAASIAPSPGKPSPARFANIFILVKLPRNRID